MTTFTPSFLPFTALYLLLFPVVPLLTRILFNPRIIGRENLRRVDRAILVSNHSLVLDPALIAHAIWPRRTYFTMLEETAMIPLLGTFIRLLGGIPLVSGPRSVVRQERGVADGVRHLGLVHFFPEGECYLRNQDIMPFHRGAFRAACRWSLPVVPVTMVLKKRTCRFLQFLDLPPHARIRIGCPLYPESSSRNAEAVLAAQTRAAMQSVIDREGGCKTMSRGAMPRLALHRSANER